MIPLPSSAAGLVPPLYLPACVELFQDELSGRRRCSGLGCKVLIPGRKLIRLGKIVVLAREGVPSTVFLVGPCSVKTDHASCCVLPNGEAQCDTNEANRRTRG